MHRFIEAELNSWQKEVKPHPLLLRGARQIGKSYTVEKFGQKNFQNLVVINFEHEPKLKDIFNDLDPLKIIQKINSEKETNIEIGKTLLFLDEIQECPNAIVALRYFYEKTPGLHVIGAGSLLDFTLRSGDFSIPVGRIHYLYLQPLSFMEYLFARKKNDHIDYIKNLDLKSTKDDYYHNALNEEVKNYMMLGGMPEVVNSFIDEQDISKTLKIQAALVTSYRDDFGKYSSKAQHKYLEKLLYGVPKNVGNKFKYVNIDPEAQSRDLKEAMDLLIHAGILYKVKRTSGAGLPFEAGASEKHFKTLFLDIGLQQHILGINKEIMTAENFHSLASGSIAEQFVGQELIANQEFYETRSIYYWAREKSDSAEVDYMISSGSKQIPVEVKAGKTGKLRSLKYFLDNYEIPLGLRISQKSISLEDKILSIPFYAISELKRLLT